MSQLLRLRDAASRLGIRPETLRRWHRRGLIRLVHTPAGAFFLDRDTLDALAKPRSYIHNPGRVVRDDMEGVNGR